MTTNYYTFGGTIFAEEAVGTSGYRNYGTDALSSVVATYDSTGGAQNSYRYSPYGQTVLNQTVAATPYFTWVGALGYRQTTRHLPEFYIRARHYASWLATWTTVDPLWPLTSSYTYADSEPVLRTDRSGLICEVTALKVIVNCQFFDKSTDKLLGTSKRRKYAHEDNCDFSVCSATPICVITVTLNSITNGVGGSLHTSTISSSIGANCGNLIGNVIAQVLLHSIGSIVEAALDAFIASSSGSTKPNVRTDCTATANYWGKLWPCPVKPKKASGLH